MHSASPVSHKPSPACKLYTTDRDFLQLCLCFYTDADYYGLLVSVSANIFEFLCIRRRQSAINRLLLASCIQLIVIFFSCAYISTLTRIIME